MGNPDLGATVTDFMSVLQSIDYSKVKRFSNVADEISAKLLSNFLECEVLVPVTDGYDFEFSTEACPNSFQNYLGNSNIKTILVKKLFQKWTVTFPKFLTSFQTNYLANLDGAKYRLASQRSKRIDFYCNHEEADSTMFAYIKFFCNNICLDRSLYSPVSDVAVIFFHQGVVNFTFLDALWFKTGTGDDIYLYTH